MSSTLNEFLEKALSESSSDKKIQGYKQGSYMLNSAFSDFSQGYMRAMGQLMQNKKSMSNEYKKLRDNIATAYERLDDAISKHLEKINKQDQVKMGR